MYWPYLLLYNITFRFGLSKLLQTPRGRCNRLFGSLVLCAAEKRNESIVDWYDMGFWPDLDIQHLICWSGSGSPILDLGDLGSFIYNLYTICNRRVILSIYYIYIWYFIWYFLNSTQASTRTSKRIKIIWVHFIGILRIEFYFYEIWRCILCLKMKYIKMSSMFLQHCQTISLTMIIHTYVIDLEESNVKLIASPHLFL